MAKAPEEVAQAFEKILQRAGMTPRSLIADVGPEWPGACARMLVSKGTISSQKNDPKTKLLLLRLALL